MRFEETCWGSIHVVRKGDVEEETQGNECNRWVGKCLIGKVLLTSK